MAADVRVPVPRQRRLTSEDAAELLGESEVTDNDLLPGKYEGKHHSRHLDRSI